MSRLQDQDFTYWFLREAFGWDVVLQLLWTFDRPVSDGALESMNRALARGTLHRRVIRPQVPLARPRWVPSDVEPVVAIDRTVVHSDDVQDWGARDLESVDLNADEGRAWRLRAARTDSGGTALSLTCLHLVADGAALTAAAATACRATVGDHEATVGDHEPGSPRRADRRAGAVSDARDAVGQVLGAARGVGRAAGTALVARRSTASPTATEAPPAATRAPVHVRSPRARPSWAVVSVDVAEWDAVAARHGGTRNSLFVAVIAGALWSTGYADDGTPLKVGIPMSLRGGADDQRTNATAGVSVRLTNRPVAGGDLGEIRRLCKEAFTAMSAGRRPAMIHLQPLLQILPLSVVTSVVTSGGSGMPDAVVSNLGAVDRSVLTVGDAVASAVAFRGSAQHVDAGDTHRFGEGLQSWYLEVDGTATFAVAGFDETAAPTATALREALAGELDRWQVGYRFW